MQSHFIEKPHYSKQAKIKILPEDLRLKSESSLVKWQRITFKRWMKKEENTYMYQRYNLALNCMCSYLEYCYYERPTE